MLFFGSLSAQNFPFKVFNASSDEALPNVKVYHSGQIIIVSDEQGNFELPGIKLPANFKFSLSGFETVSVDLQADPKIQIIYLYPKAGNIQAILLQSTIIPNTLQEIPASVNLVTDRDFKRNDATNVLESLNNVPGMYVNLGALNTSKITIRGIGARSQYSTNRIQSYFDGIPLTTAEGELTLDDFDQETLDRIEIIKGPTSSIFGAGLGGSINLYSKTEREDKSQIKLNSQYGSFNTNKNTLQASVSNKRSSIFATLSNLTSNGYRENGNYRRNSALINGNLNIGKTGKLSFLANFTKLKAFIPSSVNETTLINNPEAADVSWSQAKGYESYDRGILGVSYTQNLIKNLENTTSVFASFRDGYEPRPFDILEENRISTGLRTKFNLETKLLEIPTAISFGGEFYTEFYKTGNFKNLYKNFPNTGSVQGDRISKNQQDRNYSNFFLQTNFSLTEKWTVEAGANLNTTKYSLTDQFNAAADHQSGVYRFKSTISPRIATSYEIERGKNIFASVSQGFSIPTVSETLTPEGMINTDLKAETGTNYEAGFKGNWFGNKLYTEVAVYAIQVENLLVAQRVAEDQYVGMNAGKSTHKGLEFQANYRFDLSSQFGLQPYASFAINQFKFKEFINEDQDFSGNKLPGIPDYTLNFGLDINIKKRFDLFTNFRRVGEIPLDDANSGYANSYQVFNLKAAYHFKFFKKIHLNIYGGINNLFDEKYAASILTNAVGFGGNAPRYYYPGTERNFYGGLQTSFKF